MDIYDTLCEFGIWARATGINLSYIGQFSMCDATPRNSCLIDDELAEKADRAISALRRVDEQLFVALMSHFVYVPNKKEINYRNTAKKLGCGRSAAQQRVLSAVRFVHGYLARESEFVIAA